MTEKTSISVTTDIRERVKGFANYKDETYSNILNRVMNNAEQIERITSKTHEMFAAEIGIWKDDPRYDGVVKTIDKILLISGYGAPWKRLAGHDDV
jgi:hypothetical protein